MTISVNGGPPIPVVLNDQSLVVGQQVSFPATDGPTTVRIRLGTVSSADRSGRPDRTGVGFAEIDLGLGDSPEVDHGPDRPDDGDVGGRRRSAR